MTGRDGVRPSTGGRPGNAGIGLPGVILPAADGPAMEDAASWAEWERLVTDLAASVADADDPASARADLSRLRGHVGRADDELTRELLRDGSRRDD